MKTPITETGLEGLRTLVEYRLGQSTRRLTEGADRLVDVYFWFGAEKRWARSHDVEPRAARHLTALYLKMQKRVETIGLFARLIHALSTAEHEDFDNDSTCRLCDLVDITGEICASIEAAKKRRLDATIGGSSS